MVTVEFLDEAKGIVTEILTPLNDKPPPRTAKQIITETGVGFVAGILIGSICRKVGKLAISTVGGGITCISLLGQLGYVKVDWKKVQSDYNRLKGRQPQLDISKYPVKQLVKDNLPLASGLAGGACVAIAT